MCVIAIAEDKRIESDDVARMYETNNAGAGIAWRHKGQIIWRKGLNLQEIKDLCAALPLPYVAHFRIPTCGGPYSGLCHPFPITEDVSLELQGKTDGEVLFHNGHWTQWKDVVLKAIIESGGKIKTPYGRWSDSRALAFMAHHFNYSIVELIDERVAIFGPKVLQIFGSTWTRTDGILVSNKLWQTGKSFHQSHINQRYDTETKSWVDVNARLGLTDKYGVTIPASMGPGPKALTQQIAGAISTETPGGVSQPTTFRRGQENVGNEGIVKVEVQEVQEGLGSETGETSEGGGGREEARKGINALITMPKWVDPELNEEIDRLIASGELDLARQERASHLMDLPLNEVMEPTVKGPGLMEWIGNLNPKRYRIGGQRIVGGVITPIRSMIPPEDKPAASAQRVRLTHIAEDDDDSDYTLPAIKL